MEEAIEVIAIQQCYRVLGQYSVNQIVMFVMVIVLLAIIVWLAIYITRLQEGLRIMKNERDSLILRLSMKDGVRRGAKGNRKKG